MSGDRKWVKVGIVVTATGVIAMIWYMILGDEQQALVDLYTAGKLSDDVFAAQRSLLLAARLLPVPLVGLVLIGLLVYCQRARLRKAMLYIRIGWRLIWPLLAATLAVAFPLLAVQRVPRPLAVPLSIALLMLVLYVRAANLAEAVHLLRAALRRVATRVMSRRVRERWDYDLIRSFQDGRRVAFSTAAPEGMEVKAVTHRRSGEELGTAILQHPPWQGDAVIQYTVSDIDKLVMAVRLHGSFGIMEAVEKDGQEKICLFPGEQHEGNKVRFEVRVNERTVLFQEKDTQGWSPIKHKDFLVPHLGFLILEFRTNAMDDPHFNWAAWKDLKLVECP